MKRSYSHDLSSFLGHHESLSYSADTMDKSNKGELSHSKTQQERFSASRFGYQSLTMTFLVGAGIQDGLYIPYVQKLVGDNISARYQPANSLLSKENSDESPYYELPLYLCTGPAEYIEPGNGGSVSSWSSSRPFKMKVVHWEHDELTVDTVCVRASVCGFISLQVDDLDGDYRSPLLVPDVMNGSRLELCTVPDHDDVLRSSKGITRLFQWKGHSADTRPSAVNSNGSSLRRRHLFSRSRGTSTPCEEFDSSDSEAVKKSVKRRVTRKAVGADQPTFNGF